MSFVVFWRQDGIAQSEEFGSTEILAVNARCVALRKDQYAGSGVSHVCVSSELDDNVTLPGVADPKADYDWKKRRL